MNTSRFYYVIYGLRLGINTEIPGLQSENSIDGLTDVEVNMGSLPDRIIWNDASSARKYFLDSGSDISGQPHLAVNTDTSGNFFQFKYGYGLEFVCDKAATRVWCQWLETSSIDEARLFLMGPILGFMLRLRGTTCLHASGVVVGEQAFALAGSSGDGKSTLAAAFANKGYAVLTDDIMPLTITDDTVFAAAGHPLMKLYPESFENLSSLPEELPAVAAGWGKCYLNLNANSLLFNAHPVPLKLVYILNWGNDSNAHKIEPLMPNETVPQLAANTYRNDLLDTEMKKNEFYFLCHMVSLLKVKILQPVDDIARISELADIVLDDFQTSVA